MNITITTTDATTDAVYDVTVNGRQFTLLHKHALQTLMACGSESYVRDHHLPFDDLVLMGVITKIGDSRPTTFGFKLHHILAGTRPSGSKS